MISSTAGYMGEPIPGYSAAKHGVSTHSPIPPKSDHQLTSRSSVSWEVSGTISQNSIFASTLSHHIWREHLLATLFPDYGTTLKDEGYQCKNRFGWPEVWERWRRMRSSMVIRFILLILRCGKLKMRLRGWNQNGSGRRMLGFLIWVGVVRVIFLVNLDCKQWDLKVNKSSLDESNMEY